MKYDVSGSNLWNPCMHLCNYSINKHHSDYVASDNLEADDRGHKWSISAFLKHLRANGLNTAALMQSIEVEFLNSAINIKKYTGFYTLLARCLQPKYCSQLRPLHPQVVSTSTSSCFYLVMV